MDVTDLPILLERCIAYVYSVPLREASGLKADIASENPMESQTSVPILTTILKGVGHRKYRSAFIPARAIPGTDVRDGHVTVSRFYKPPAGVPRAQCMATVLQAFVELPDEDPRKVRLVNILMQLQEAFFNCSGRHKEVPRTPSRRTQA